MVSKIFFKKNIFNFLNLEKNALKTRKNLVDYHRFYVKITGVINLCKHFFITKHLF